MVVGCRGEGEEAGNAALLLLLLLLMVVLMVVEVEVGGLNGIARIMMGLWDLTTAANRCQESMKVIYGVVQ